MTEVKIPTAREWMTRDTMTLRPEAELLQAIRQMASKAISAALVVDEKGTLVGILTEKDCLRVLTLSTYHDAKAGKVSEFMSPVPECVEPEMDLFRISGLFLETNFAVLPVLEGDRLLGQISRQQMLRAIDTTARAAEAESQDKLKMEERAEESLERPRSIQEMQDFFSKSSRDQMVSRLKRKG